MMPTPAFIILTLAAILSGSVSVLLWQRRSVQGVGTLALLMLSVAGWSLVAALEAASIQLSAKILWSQFEYLGSGTAMTLYLFFALQRAGLKTSLNARKSLALWLLPIVNFLLALTNRWHGQLWIGFEPASVGVNQITYLHGSIFFGMVAVIYIYALLASILLIRTTLHSGLIRKRQNASVLLAAAIPFVGGLFYVLNPAWLAGINITPMSFSISGLILAVGVIGMRYFDIAPVARDTLFEFMDDGVLVLNESDRIIDINPAACRFLDTDSSCIGSPVDAVLSPWPELLKRCRQSDAEHYEVLLSESPLRVIDARLTPIIGKDSRQSGLIVVLRAITARVHNQRKLQEANDLLMGQVAEISRLQESVREQAIHDALTGLFNRRYLEETLPREVASSRRRNAPMSVILLDIDFFKTVNDTYGHQVGDRTLQALAELLDASTRKGDIACRYGGDEFVLVLPDTALVDAVDKAESLRLKCSSLDQDGCSGVTISLGVACAPDHGDTGGSILLVADRALYRAKEAGRDQVHTGPTS
jgi:diguanylate cyclase (GGDEF)-like protein